MNILICGAGEVGSHTAEELAAGNHRITMIDKDAGKLRHHVLSDVATLGTRIADELAGLVEGLGVLEHLRSGETEAEDDQEERISAGG